MTARWSPPTSYGYKVVQCTFIVLSTTTTTYYYYLLRIQGREVYLSSFWNKVDISTLALMTGCLVARLAVWVDGGDALSGGTGALDLSAETLLQLSRLIQSLFAISSIGVILRFVSESLPS